MEIEITAIQCEVSDSIKAYVRDKIGRLDKFFDKARKTAVSIHAEPGQNSIELVCSASRGATFHVAVETDGSIQEAIDLAYDKMAKQLSRFKGKLRSHKGAKNREKFSQELASLTQRLEKLVAEVGEEGETYEDTLDDDR